MVLNPPSIVGAEPKNITGASMNVPVEQTIRLFKQLGPQVRRIGAVYDRAKTGYLVRRAEAVARDEGLQLITKEIRSAKEAIPALDFLQESRIDALWILPDETNLAPAVVQQMLLLVLKGFHRSVPAFTVLGLKQKPA